MLANGSLLSYFSHVKNVPVFVLTILFVTCETKSTYTTTEKDRQVISAYTALSILNSSFPATSAPDSIRIYRARVDSILGHEGLSLEEFRSAMESLAYAPERFQQLFLEINGRLQKQPGAGTR